MGFIDMHCDTLMMAALTGKKATLFDADKLCVDFNKLKKGNAIAQFFAIFMPDDDTYNYFKMKPMKDQEYFDLLFALYLSELKAHKDIICPAHTAQDIDENMKKGKMSAVLTMEDGRMVNGDFDKLDEFYDLGIRALTLTWNYANCFGFPHSKEPSEMMKGLTPFGKDAVDYMNEIGMLVDVSHLSDGGFWDVCKVSKKPFVATHSNCRELCPHSRNLSDEMIKALAEKGGVIGLNFYPAFLNKDLNDKVGRIDAMVEHLKHMVNVGGIEVAALGSDFDGMSGDLEVANCSEYGKLFEAMKKAGFTEGEIEKISYRNVMRVMKECLW